MSNDLLTPEALATFPGAPFSEQVVDAAVAAIRDAAGWHIAPSRTEVVTVDSEGGRILMLPTLRLDAATEVTDLSGETPREVTGWRKSRSGYLSGRSTWPCGPETVSARITHGYNQCPAEILTLVAAVALGMSRDTTVVQQSTGPWSMTFRDGTATAMTQGDLLSGSAVIARYRIPGRA